MTATAQHLQQRIEQQAQRSKIKKLIAIAEKYGVIHKGWTAADYMREAVKNFGWESTAITGPKGTAKSNLLLQRGYSIYEDWAKVHKHTITEREPFLLLLEEAIEGEVRIPWLGVDDIATIFPKSLYFTNRKLYSELQSSWETLRTVVSNFDFTATRKNKVATFITNDITGDIITYNRKGEVVAYYQYSRWLWLRNLKDPTEMVAKLISIEDIPFPLTPDSFKVMDLLRTGEFISGGHVYQGEEYFRTKARLTGVPRDQFIEYWNNRLKLASTAYHRFKRILEQTKGKEVKTTLTPEQRSAINTENASHPHKKRLREAQGSDESESERHNP